MNPVIRVENVSKKFRKVEALRGVSLEIPRGVVWALLGRNGAGKTTLIKILLGLLDPDDGKAEVLGHDCQRESLEIRRRVGYVPEQPGLYEWMRVDEIGQFCAAFYPAGYFTAYLEHIKKFGLDPQKKIKELSKGMRAMVLLALAISHDPDLLILDEPTSGLDVIVRRQFLESMVDRAATGKTVFLASHQVHEVERVADVVGFLKEGQLILVDEVEKLKREIRRWVLIFDNPQSLNAFLNILTSFPLEIIQQKREGLECHIIARSSGDSEPIRQATISGLRSIDAFPCSLEEIFTAYMNRETEPAFSRQMEEAP
ncbi:MAG: ABC transporter ATP-binding protein [Thermogutta sp.]|uniref:ABC transporter ATP-binding protein n=1 Tax=Thermogutta sp. TaxID=1962930 RepID=UPI0019A0A2F8|nr:ABC transporter ATP-binding protein [Thermogutta sp.]MBC7351913.1 ABC transporter ATP-binding protein [Thermogutta sp.]